MASEFHDTLNPKLWVNNKLKPEVASKLIEIADAFIESMEVPRNAIKDIVITGSSASYNYTPHSDIDLHLIVDFDKVHKDCPIVGDYLISKKSEFNNNHDIYIYGVPVEVYAEATDNENVHNGLYSLKDKYNIKVVNFSIAIETTEMCDDTTALYYYAWGLLPLYQRDILVVSAAGNMNANAKTSCVNVSEQVIVVSSIDKNMKKAASSNYGIVVDFAAPGVGIMSAQRDSGENDTHPLDGTSQAAPHVSANIALLYNACPTCSVSSIEEILLNSAVDIGEDEYYGHGYIDMNKSYEYYIPPRLKNQ